MSTNTKKWIGKIFGKLRIISCDDTTPPHYYVKFNCECNCGKDVKILKDVMLWRERNGKNNSCGCSHLTTGKSNWGKRYNNRALRHIGEKHNYLTIVGIERIGRGYWMVCKCSCGNTTKQRYADIKKGKVKSCGCYQKEQVSISGSKNGLNNCTKNCNKHNWHVIQDGIKIKMRSGYEVMYAIAMNNRNVLWKYEPKCFVLKRGMRYTPDFYLPQTDKWIEVKGQLRTHSIKKMKEFKKQGNKLTLIRINGIKRIFGLSYSGFRKRWDKGYYKV